MCFREFTDTVSCPVSHTKQKVSLELTQSTLFCVDGGAGSTTLLFEPCLINTGIGEQDLQNILHTHFSEDEWAEKVLTFEGAEAVQTQINEFRKTVSFECCNLAVPHSVRKKVNENRNVKSPGLELLASAKHQVVLASQKCLETSGPALADSVIYSDPDMKLYFEGAEIRSKHVADLTLYTSERVERKFTEIEAASDEVASSLLVSKMDLKAVQAKVGGKPDSDFLSGLSLWDAFQKLVNIGGRTGITHLAAKGVSLTTGSYLDSVICSGSSLNGILASYKKHISLLQKNVKKLMDGSPVSVGLGLHNGPAPPFRCRMSRLPTAACYKKWRTELCFWKNRLRQGKLLGIP